MCCLFYFHLYIDRDKTCKFYDSDICVVGRVFSLLTKELLKSALKPLVYLGRFITLSKCGSRIRSKREGSSGI